MEFKINISSYEKRIIMDALENSKEGQLDTGTLAQIGDIVIEALK